MQIMIQTQPDHEWENKAGWLFTIHHEGNQIGVPKPDKQENETLKQNNIILTCLE